MDCTLTDSCIDVTVQLLYFVFSWFMMNIVKWPSDYAFETTHKATPFTSVTFHCYTLLKLPACLMTCRKYRVSNESLRNSNSNYT